MKRLVKVWIIIQVLSIPLIALCFKIDASVRESKYQKRIVATAISAEACGEGAHGMLAVASTIQNRVKRSGKSAYDIVTEPNQYHGHTARHRHKRYAECKDIANMLTDNIGHLQDITDGAIYFNDCKPKSYHGKFTVKIGAHCFYQEKKE